MTLTPKMERVSASVSVSMTSNAVVASPEMASYPPRSLDILRDYSGVDNHDVSSSSSDDDEALEHETSNQGEHRTSSNHSNRQPAMFK